jgi:hypothetical protein
MRSNDEEEGRIEEPASVGEALEESEAMRCLRKMLRDGARDSGVHLGFDGIIMYEFVG